MGKDCASDTQELNKLRSSYEEMFPKDNKQYVEFAKKFIDLKPENVQGAYELMMESWALAQRWAELQSCSQKIKTLQQNKETSSFKEWCHVRYKQLAEASTTCRVIWKMGQEVTQWESNKINEMGRK